MKKILIIIGILIIAIISILNYGVSIKIQEELYLKIDEQNKNINGELGSLKINIKKEDIKCRGFGIYTCLIKNPKFGIKDNSKKDIFKAKDIKISNLNVFTGRNILLSINEVNIIDESLLEIEDIFPLNLELSLDQAQENKISKIYFKLTNKSLKLTFNTMLESLNNKDSKIINYDINIENINIKDFIYNLYKGLLKDQVPQIISMTNKILTGEESFEIKTKKSVIDGFSNMVAKSTTLDNTEEIKKKIDIFLNKKNSILRLTAKNKTGITLNQMVTTQGTPLENFIFTVDVK